MATDARLIRGNPQRDGERLLLDLPPAPSGDAGARRLEIVYEAPIDAFGLLGRSTLPAPELRFHSGRGAAGGGAPVPVADTIWDLSLPPAYRTLASKGTMVTGGSGPKGLKGNTAEVALGRASITCNKNGIPFDPEKPTVTSGVRLGSPAPTTRGFGVEEFGMVADMIVEVLDGLATGNGDNSTVEAAVRKRVSALCARFPVYPTL